jgi:molybdopterin molybdotransferase
MNMISFREAYKIVMNAAFETGTEIISFTDSEGRILATDITSDIYMPSFNRSAVDGYACHKADLLKELEIMEVLPAGKVPQLKPGENQCSKIMTGAIVPEGCDIVIMIEDTEILTSGKVRFTGNNLKTNLSFRGEDVRPGDIVVRCGKFIKPQDIAVMASVGKTNVSVKKMPKTGIISTGDELVEPWETPSFSKIRNSNAPQLMSQVKRAGGSGFYYGIAPDDEDETFRLICKALNENEIVILTGGVSMGDFDFVPSVLEQAGVKILFDKVNVQPGKPTTFGIHPNGVVFGLPGNPVSSFIQFETLVRPFLNKTMGYDWKPLVQQLTMAVRYERKSAGRMGWIPVSVTDNMEVMPVEFHGSAHISALSLADGIVSLNPGKTILEKGEIVSVRQI